MMKSYQDAIFKQDLEDGVDYLPRSPGTYCILNRVNGKVYVGQAGNVYKRCQQHRNELRRGMSSNFLMRRDAEVNGMDAFFFVLRLDGLTESPRPFEVDKIEVWLSVQLRSHDERYGYNLEAGHRRTTGALFRDRERKLMRRNSRKYMLLPWVHMYDPIQPALLAHWDRRS
jgi:hypothetical protein